MSRYRPTIPFKAVRQSAQLFNLIKSLSMKNQIIYVDPTTLIDNQVVTEIYSVNQDYLYLYENIKAMGVLKPLLVDERNVVISGSLRRLIAIELGITSVPVIVYVNDELDTDAFKSKAVSHAQQMIKIYSQLLEKFQILCELPRQ